VIWPAATRREQRHERDHSRKKQAIKLSREAMYQIIRSPVITGKATLLSEKTKYVLRVSLRRTRAADQAASRLFGVNVVAVNTIVRKGKTKRVKGRPGRARTSKRNRSPGEEPRRSISPPASHKARRKWHSDNSIRSLPACAARADRSFRSVERRPVKGLTEASTVTAGATITAGSPPGSWRRTQTVVRIVDFKRKKFTCATVERLEYDPNRTAFHWHDQVWRQRTRLTFSHRNG